MRKLKVYRLTSNTQFAFTADADATFPRKHQTKTKHCVLDESIFQINVCISWEKL